MLRLLTDADVHGDIIRGLRRRLPDIDLVRVQDALPEGAPDPEVLAWAAAENRVLVSNDRNTMVGFAYQRVTAGEPVPGLIATTKDQSIGSTIDDLLVIAECMSAKEIRDQIVVFLHLRHEVRALFDTNLRPQPARCGYGRRGVGTRNRPAIPLRSSCG